MKRIIYKLKLKIKTNWKIVLVSLVQFSFVFAIGWFFEHLLEMLIIVPCFFYFRTKFEKQWHAKDALYCTIYTMAIFSFIAWESPDLALSIFIIVLYTFLINSVSYRVRDYLDIKYPKRKKKNTNRQTIINILGSDNLTEEQIEEYCVSIGYPKLSETIYLFLNNTVEETADILAVDATTITRRINRFIKSSQNKK